MGRLSLPLSPFRHAQWRAVPIPTEPTELQAELKAMGIEPCGRARREGRKPLMAIEREGARRIVNVSYAGFIGSVTGMNEKQVAIGEMGGGGQGKWDGTPMVPYIPLT